MDHKIIDIVCGDISTLIAMKSLDLEHKGYYSYPGNNTHTQKRPLFSGEELNYANVIMVNDKTESDLLYSGISYAMNKPTTDKLGHTVKVFNQTMGSKDNPYNFLSKSLVG